MNFVEQCLMRNPDDDYAVDDYKKSVPRWCAGCGDNGILATVQRLCKEEQLTPEKTVFVSGIGCSSRFPHYMNTYGFHGLHGRALPVAEGVKVKRPDLNVFVVMGDGDCCSIGAQHWIHAIRYNMDMTVLMLDNQIYGLTKMQASPTTPHGLKSNTTPRGSYLEPLNPLTVTLGVSGVSFVAQAVDWAPDVLFDILSMAYRHKGLSFVRVLQRCPEFMPGHFDAWVHDPDRIQLLDHEDGIQASESTRRIYTNRLVHDPIDIHQAREIASSVDPIPVGVLYSNPDVVCYEDSRRHTGAQTSAKTQAVLDHEFDRYSI